eukprot:GHVO01055366.1.p2 GENE.GHVO01055366.1~~GHVO01055366.1.p2  ORF type:complete len:135 (+),score=7.02 GHVO01055366.1:3-407(+)
MCEAVVPLAIVVVILSFTSFGLFMVLVWTYFKLQRRSSSYDRSISRATASRPQRAPAPSETEAYFTNMGMSTSTGSVTGATAKSTSSRQPAPRGISPAPSHSTYGHQTGRVHDPPKYHPGTSQRSSGGSQYGRY